MYTWPHHHQPPTSIWGCTPAVTASREPHRPEGRKEASEERRLHWHRGHYIGVTKWRREKAHSFFGSLLPSSSLGPLSSLSSNNACRGKKKTIHSIIHVREAAFDFGQGLTRGGATFKLSFAVLSWINVKRTHTLGWSWKDIDMFLFLIFPNQKPPQVSEY